MANSCLQTGVGPTWFFFVPFIEAFLEMVFLIMTGQVPEPAGALAWGWGSAGQLKGRDQTPGTLSPPGAEPCTESVPAARREGGTEGKPLQSLR